MTKTNLHEELRLSLIDSVVLKDEITAYQSADVEKRLRLEILRLEQAKRRTTHSFVVDMLQRQIEKKYEEVNTLLLQC